MFEFNLRKLICYERSVKEIEQGEITKENVECICAKYDQYYDDTYLGKSKFTLGKLINESKNDSSIPKEFFDFLDELNDFFTFCDTRNGHSTIHSWEMQRTTKKEREICMAILRNRRKKDYGDKDGNPIPFDKLQNLVLDGVKQEELDSLVEKRILRYVPDQGYEFANSKNSAGINGVYRIYLPTATLFSTLTATGTKDCVAMRAIEASSTDEYKEKFLKEIYSAKAFKSISSRDAGRLQGFPPEFIYHENNKLAMKQFGNAVSVPVVYYVALQLVKTGIFDL